ncbi:MAG: hypothetical protein JW973_09580 [Bacteroidales bacterium]|nr:hypothetical protein [Bacteroidales bacterium]
MKKIFVLMIVSLSLTYVSGQNEKDFVSKSNEFGIHAGATTGIGLSYRHWFDKVGFQLTALPIRTEKLTFISAGATALYSFYDSKYVMVFGYLGGHYFMQENDEERYNDRIGRFETYPVEEESFSFGIGPGFAFGRVVRFNLMVGYGFYDVFEKFNMFPTAEIGLYYRF